MKTELVFKLEKNPDGYRGQTFCPSCEVKINNPKGFLYLNYEHREERIMGHYSNLRREGEVILADVELFEKHKILEPRFEYAIEGGIISRNDKNEITSVTINGVSVLMHNKF